MSFDCCSTCSIAFSNQSSNGDLSRERSLVSYQTMEEAVITVGRLSRVTSRLDHNSRSSHLCDHHVTAIFTIMTDVLMLCRNHPFNNA